MRVLLVEDDEKIARFIAEGLRQEGHAVDWAQDGDEGLLYAERATHDAAIVDVMLPRRDGLQLVEDMRRQRIETPVIVLSAKGSVDDRIRGLHVGGDDYLAKPFSFAELVARLNALVRRAAATRNNGMTLSYGGIEMDLLSRTVTREGRSIPLQAKEFALLEYFLRNAGRVLTKTMILEHVWDYSFDPQTNVVDVLVCRLRNRIDRDFNEKLIHTLRGVGYVLRES